MESSVTIQHELEQRHVVDALDILYAAFARKFRIGFAGPAQFRRLFADVIDPCGCITATQDDRLLGVLTCQTLEDGDFYRVSTRSLFTRFWPWRSLRMLINLALLEDKVQPDEFIVGTIAVSEGARGLGVGTTLMNEAEKRARTAGKRLMSLDVAGNNDGARRLYKRLGYRVTSTRRSLIYRIITGDPVVHHMEKSLAKEE